MGLWQELKEFAIKGNALDLAVGVVIGAAFGKIISALVDSIIMPFVSLLSGGVNFISLKLKLANPAPIPDLTAREPATLEYGKFVQTTVDFLLWLSYCSPWSSCSTDGSAPRLRRRLPRPKKSFF